MISSAFDKTRKKKRRKRRVKEGKRSGSSTSPDGSPELARDGSRKPLSSCSCPPRITNSDTKDAKSSSRESDLGMGVNESLRWPADNLYVENQIRAKVLLELVGKFPATGKTQEEEDERIAIYKMNRRKRYLAAQQAILAKYPDTTIYASSSASSTATNHTDGARSSSSGISSRVASESGKSGYMSSISSTSVSTTATSSSTRIHGSETRASMQNGMTHQKQSLGSHIQLTHIPHIQSGTNFTNQMSENFKSTNFKIAIPVQNGI